ncbi:PREDICTED: uncharacterized protein LOC109152641 isoform X2 [Ipomoea nil]|uniref:uncharacterized protein LOC109152641 isoform X2 n=1 Tax=Ipomoea nil TaxID=35883 RepID=UPI000901AAA7|nr:PREDICTED: uncharacterized protein LOC109152641 isoform X2 [Ipomoea nil]
MAAGDQQELDPFGKLFSSYLGLSFALSLAHLPTQAISALSRLKTHNRELTFQVSEAEEQLKELLLRRKEDSKANARVVEIFATHRHAWQRKERRLLQQIDEEAEEVARLRERVAELEKTEAELKRAVGERDEMLGFLSSSVKTVKTAPFSSREVDSGNGGCYSEMGLRFGEMGVCEEMEECFLGGRVNSVEEKNMFSPDFLNSASKFWTERASPWPYESRESLYNSKHYVTREAAWKESAGVSSKLKQLELELLNLEIVGKPDLSKVTSLMQKQAEIYRAISGKIDDLCQRMQDSDPCEPAPLGSEFRTQKQTDFLLEAFRLQQHASETGQKLLALQSKTGKARCGDDSEGQASVAARRSIDLIRNTFKEIQRSLEIWLARIIGDLEGILARDGVSRAKDYFISSYPLVQQ